MDSTIDWKHTLTSYEKFYIVWMNKYIMTLFRFQLNIRITIVVIIIWPFILIFCKIFPHRILFCQKLNCILQTFSLSLSSGKLSSFFSYCITLFNLLLFLLLNSLLLWIKDVFSNFGNFEPSSCSLVPLDLRYIDMKASSFFLFTAFSQG